MNLEIETDDISLINRNVAALEERFKSLRHPPLQSVYIHRNATTCNVLDAFLLANAQGVPVMVSSEESEARWHPMYCYYERERIEELREFYRSEPTSFRVLSVGEILQNLQNMPLLEVPQMEVGPPLWFMRRIEADLYRVHNHECVVPTTQDAVNLRWGAATLRSQAEQHFEDARSYQRRAEAFKHSYQAQGLSDWDKFLAAQKYHEIQDEADAAMQEGQKIAADAKTLQNEANKLEKAIVQGIERNIEDKV